MGLFGDGILDTTSSELLLNLAELTLDAALLQASYAAVRRESKAPSPLPSPQR
jgi:hypothetical protein